MPMTVSPDAISIILANPSPDSSSKLPEIIIQVVNLKSAGTKYMYAIQINILPKTVCGIDRFTANDGKMNVGALLQSSLSSQVISGNIQNLGLIRVLDYALNDIPAKNEKYLIVSKCEAVSPALEAEYKAESGLGLKPKESESNGFISKPKQEVVSKSASQNVSPTMSIRRKINNETVPKRDITIADETKKTVVVSLWGDHATNVGQELLDMSDNSPGCLSLSAVSKSIIAVNPDTPEAKRLRSWYDSEGKDSSLASIASEVSPSTKGELGQSLPSSYHEQPIIWRE
ncbi:hypothetical protein OROGR_029256 [Orobanche gracilis]